MNKKEEIKMTNTKVVKKVETTIELDLHITKVIETEPDAALARSAADKAVRAILRKLDSCDSVQVLKDKRFPDLQGDGK